MQKAHVMHNVADMLSAEQADQTKPWHLALLQPYYPVNAQTGSERICSFLTVIHVSMHPVLYWFHV